MRYTVKKVIIGRGEKKQGKCPSKQFAMMAYKIITIPGVQDVLQQGTE